MKTAKITIALLAAVAVSVVISVPSEAEEKGFSVQARGEKRLALVIGNADYKTAPLKNTVNDANDMEKALKKLGFDVLARINAGHKDMEEIIREFGAKLRKNDVGLFYYSGHGVQSNGENYLIPTDAEIRKESDLKYAAVNAGKVLDEMTDAGNRLNIVILDACRDNSLPKSFRSARQGLAQMDAPSGMLIAYATSPNSTASDGSRRNGTYTENLLKHMTVPGLPIEKLFKEVRKGVLQDSGNKQRPWESVSITDDFYFLADSGSIATEKPQIPAEPAKPKQATLNITADVSGAEVWVNGNKQGVLPRNFTISESGKYEVEVTAPGYKKYRTSKNIELGKEYEVAVHLEKEQVEAAPAPVVKPSVFQKPKPSSVAKYRLRSEPMTVSEDDALKVFGLKEDDRGYRIPVEYIQNDFSDNGDGTVTDRATGLMWQKSGSDKILKYMNNYGKEKAYMDALTYEEAKAYIDKLNSRNFAGHNDWRLPTFDELKSLLTQEKQSNGLFNFNGLYINPIFDKKQNWCWTSDNRASGGAWLVYFDRGGVGWGDSVLGYSVRAVRSLQ